MDLKTSKVDFYLLLLLIFLVLFLSFVEERTNLIDNLRNRISLKLAYFVKLKQDIEDFFKDFKRFRNRKVSFLDIDNHEIFRSLMLYYRNKYKQLLELNGFSFKNDFILSKLLDTRYTHSGVEYILEAADASRGSILVDPRLRRIVGIIEITGKDRCIAAAPENRNFSLPVDVRINGKEFLSSILKGNGNEAFIEVFEENLDLSGGEVSLSSNHKLYNVLNEIGCTYIGEIDPIPIERNGYKSYKVRTFLPESEYLLIVR